MTLDDFIKMIADITHVPVSQIKKSSSIRDDLGVDSLQMVNLIILVSERFGLDLNQINSIKDIDTVEKMYRVFMKGGSS